MEKVEIVGVREVNFKDDDGREVSGRSLYYLMEADRVDGKMAGKFFVSAKRWSGLTYAPRVGDRVWVSYDRFGKASDFQLIDVAS